jgi:hypothetical protein
MEKLITPKQLSKLHALLNQAGLTDHKRELISGITNHRTESSRDLTYPEVIRLITCLEEYSGVDALRRKVFALAYKTGLIYGDSADDKKMNIAKLNRFLLERGTVKKEISKMTKPELTKTVSQFAAMLKNNIKAKENLDANKEVGQLLNELNLQVK